jgi:hypothetical protein
VLEPSAGTITFTSFLPQDASTTYTRVLTTAIDGTSGIVVVEQPSAGTITTSRTYGASYATSTLGYANGTTSGTIRYDLPEPTITTTSFLATNASTYISTYAAEGTSLGSVVHGERMAGENTYTVYAVATTTRTVTLQTASGTASGIVEVIVPSYYNTVQTTLYTGTTTSFSVISQPTGTSLGTGEVFIPYNNTFLMQVNQPGGQFDGYFVHSTGSLGYLNLSPNPLGPEAQFAIGPDSFLYSISTGNQMVLAIDVATNVNPNNNDSIDALRDFGPKQTQPITCWIGQYYSGGLDKRDIIITPAQSGPSDPTDLSLNCNDYYDARNGNYYYEYLSWFTANNSAYIFMTYNSEYVSYYGGFTGVSDATITIVPLADFEENPFPGYQITTSYLPATAAPYVTTAPGNQATSATIIYATPSASTVTTSITSGISNFTTTLATGYQTSAGTVEVVQAQGTVTTTTYLATDAAPYTSTAPAAGTTSGTVVFGIPSAGYKTTTTYGPSSQVSETFTTTLTSATGASSGLVEVDIPPYTPVATSVWSGQGTSTSVLTQPTGTQLGTTEILVPNFQMQIISQNGSQYFVQTGGKGSDYDFQATNSASSVPDSNAIYTLDSNGVLYDTSGSMIVLDGEYSNYSPDGGCNLVYDPPVASSSKTADIPMTCSIDNDHKGALVCSTAGTGPDVSFWLCNTGGRDGGNLVLQKTSSQAVCLYKATCVPVNVFAIPA